jgi:hypothetical protein
MKRVKTLDFVYEWIGPSGPISNTRMPNVADLAWSQYQNSQPLHDFVHHPFFINDFPNARITTPGRMPNGKFIYELNFSNIDYRDWKHFFDIRNGVLSNNYHSERVFDRIRNERNGYILVTVLFEAWVFDGFFDAMINFFKHHNIPLTQVIYATNCYNGQDIYNDYCKRRGIRSEINVEYFPTFRIHRTDIELVLNKYKDIPYQPGTRQKAFLCFQRRFNKHRIAVLLNAVKNNSIDQYYMSMDNKHPDGNIPFTKEASRFVKQYPQYNFTDTVIEHANNILPLTLDTDNFSSYPMESTQFSTEHFYKTSLINIISETYFFDREIHLTEKTWKPIAFKQPFIMVGAKGTLQHIKDLGFKTFSEFWDESYDQCNDVERMQRIFNIVNEISTWSAKQQKDFTVSAKKIVEHNFNWLLTMHDTELDNFRNKYGN